MSVLPCSRLILLAPELSLLLISDISDDISVKIRLYADDCVLYNEVTCVDDQIRLNDDKDKNLKWLST